MTTQAQNPIVAVLRLILSPAMWLLGRLRFAWKFTAITLLILTPSLLASRTAYKGVTYRVDFNGAGVHGMVYMVPLEALLDAQQRHWVASVGRASGHKDMAGTESASEARAAQILAEIDKIDAGDNHMFSTVVPDGAERVSKRWKDVKSEWAKVLQANKSGVAADIHAAHAAALAVTSDFVVNYISNYSNLILDPDLDSYWLMDFCIAKGPTIGIDYANAASLAILGLSGDKTDWIAGITGSITDASLLVGYTETINLATSIATTKDYGKNDKIAPLKAPYDELKQASTALFDVIKNSHVRPLIVGAAAPTEGAAPAPPKAIDMGGLFAASTALFDKLHKYYVAQNVPLDELWALRTTNHKAERLSGVLFTLLAVILSFLIFTAFYFNVADSIATLAVATTRMITGTNERFASPTKDEIGDVVGDFNQINHALIQARELQRSVQQEQEQTQANIVQLLQVVSDASDGNLTVRAETSAGSLGNVSDAFNLLMESLERLVGDVSKQVSESERAVQSIATVARKMATGATNQTKEVVAARQLVDDVAKQITQVSTNAEGASQASRRTAETAEQGEKAVENVIHGMEALRANVQSGAKKMKNLGDRSMEITSIVGTISRISEQTNMLALNAAIEAARAGEHGRGFSVVADEVRKLAERATNATKDIEKLVKAINADTSDTIKAIEQQTQVVEEESRTVGAAGDSLRKIRTASDQSAGLVAGITTVTKVQVEQAQRVAKTMENVSAIANDTQNGAETTVTTINELVRLSTELKKSIGQFRITGAR